MRVCFIQANFYYIEYIGILQRKRTYIIILRPYLRSYVSVTFEIRHFPKTSLKTVIFKLMHKQSLRAYDGVSNTSKRFVSKIIILLNESSVVCPIIWAIVLICYSIETVLLRVMHN